MRYEEIPEGDKRSWIGSHWGWFPVTTGEPVSVTIATIVAISENPERDEKVVDFAVVPQNDSTRALYCILPCGEMPKEVQEALGNPFGLWMNALFRNAFKTEEEWIAETNKAIAKNIAGEEKSRGREKFEVNHKLVIVNERKPVRPTTD